MKTRFALIAACVALALPVLVFAQEKTPFSLKSRAHQAIDAGHRFDFVVANTGTTPVRAQGRVVVLNVYDTRQPKTLPIVPVMIPAGAEATLAVIWPDPPAFGQVRALLVLNDGSRPSLVESFGFWILPWKQAGAALAGLLALLVALFGIPRFLKYLRERVPPGMIAYIVEYDDTVMSLSNRFDVGWQEVVRANRLKPPYELQPGTRIFLPKHGLKRPSADAAKS